MSQKKITVEDVHQHWESAASQSVDAQGLQPTARDPYLQQVVEAAVLRHLPPGGSLLDLGCGTGHSSAVFARRCRKVVGVDYIEAFVQRATAAFGGDGVEFVHGDVLNLADVVGRYWLFDAAVSIRCLINLPEFSLQASAIQQVASAIRSGGLYLVSEGWFERFEKLNERRELYGLKPMNVAEYNTLLPLAAFEREVEQYFEIVDYESLGYYLFQSRVFQPLLTFPQEPRHDHPVNRVTALIQERLFPVKDFLDCDYAGLYVLRRK